MYVLVLLTVASFPVLHREKPSSEKRRGRPGNEAIFWCKVILILSYLCSQQERQWLSY